MAKSESTITVTVQLVNKDVRKQMKVLSAQKEVEISQIWETAAIFFLEANGILVEGATTGNAQQPVTNS